MKIEIWSDFVCPFCYIGKRRMEMALDQFSSNKNIMIVYKSYELDPNSENNTGMNMHGLLAKKYGMSIEKAKEKNDAVSEQGKEAGITYHFDTMQCTNTFDAHRLAQYARKKGKGHALTEALFHACFTESKNISDHGTLLELASSVGLQKENVLMLLESMKYTNFVRDDEEQAKQIGVDKLPFFVFNEEFAVSGVQSVEMLLEVMEKVQEKEEPVISHEAETTICAADSCEIKRDE